MLLSSKVATSPPYLLHPQTDEYHVPYSHRCIYIRMAEIKHALPCCQEGLYGRDEAKFYHELREISVSIIAIPPIPNPV